MAVIYLRSTDGNDGDSGLTWALAKATLAAALTAAGAGGTVYVSQVHAETQSAAMTLASPGTAASPVTVLCGNDAAEPPTALATTATVTTTNSNDINFTGFAYFYGVTFSAGSTTGSSTNMSVCSSAGAAAFWFDTCTLKLGNTGGNARLQLGAVSSAQNDQRVVLVNCTLLFSDVGHGVHVRCAVEMLGGAVAPTGSVPTGFHICGGDVDGNGRFRGVNLSTLASGKSLVDLRTTASSVVLRFEQCKLGASVALTTGTPTGPGGPVVVMDNCDSGDTNYRMQRHQYEGDVYSEIVVVRTSGASDGATPLAHKLVSSANAKFTNPLAGPELVQWNEATGSAKTLTVEIVHDSVTALTDADVWLEVEYLGTSGFPLSLFVSDRAADILATPAAQTTSSVAWTTTGITDVNKQKLAVTVTPQEKGFFRARVMLAKASKTVYVDPVLVIS